MLVNLLTPPTNSVSLTYTNWRRKELLTNRQRSPGHNIWHQEVSLLLVWSEVCALFWQPASMPHPGLTERIAQSSSSKNPQMGHRAGWIYLWGSTPTWSQKWVCRCSLSSSFAQGGDQCGDNQVDQRSFRVQWGYTSCTISDIKTNQQAYFEGSSTLKGDTLPGNWLIS